MSTFRVKASINELIEDAPVLILDADVDNGDGTITVKSILSAAINQVLLIREPGNERAEIVKSHGSTAPSGNTITLAANTVEDHPAGTRVYIISADKLHFYHSATEDDANVSAVNLTELASAQVINPTEVINFYNDSANTSGFYYYRFENSITSVNEPYSDPFPYSLRNLGSDENTVGAILESVEKMFERELDNRFSKKMAISSINRCLEYIQGKMRRWNRYLVSDYKLGQTQRGVYAYDLPVNIYDNQTNRSVTSVSISGSLEPLTWCDEKEFDEIMNGAKHTTVRTQAVVGATTLDAVNTYDFGDTGSIDIFTGNTDDLITYTGVTRSTTVGVFTGIPASGTGSLADTHAVDVNIWQDHEEGEPRFYTVREGQILVYPLPDATWINKNIYLDYNTAVTKVDSEADIVDTERNKMVFYWVMWEARAAWTAGGKRDLKDPDFIMFQDILKTVMKTTPIGQKSLMVPKINTIKY